MSKEEFYKKTTNNIFEVYQSKWKTILIFIIAALFFGPCLFIIYCYFFGIPQNEFTYRITSILNVNSGFWSVLFLILIFLLTFWAFRKRNTTFSIINKVLLIFFTITLFLPVLIFTIFETNWSLMLSEISELIIYIWSIIWVKITLIILLGITLWFLTSKEKLIFAINDKQFYYNDFGWINLDDVIYIATDDFMNQKAIIFNVKDKNIIYNKLKGLNKTFYENRAYFIIIFPGTTINIKPAFEKLKAAISKYKPIKEEKDGIIFFE